MFAFRHLLDVENIKNLIMFSIDTIKIVACYGGQAG